MIRWMREAYSPVALLAIWLLAWLPAAGLCLMFWRITGDRPEQEIRLLSLFIAGVVLFGAAVARVLFRHPLSRTGYADWLARTPWTPADPLPDGPVLPTVQDVLALIVLCAPAWLIDRERAWVPFQAIVTGYLLALAGTVLSTGPRGYAYAAGFGFIAMAATAAQRSPNTFFMLATVVSWVVGMGYQRSLTRFPWPRTESAGDVGWPYRTMAPPAAPQPLQTWEGVTLACLAGWGTLVFGVFLDDTPDETGRPKQLTLVLVPAATIFAATCRILAYTTSYFPPINLFGRVATGRFVIPGYDVVLLAPLCGILASGLIPQALRAAGVWTPVASGVGMAVGMGVVCCVGPSRQVWQLTAPCRLTGVFDKTPQQQARTTNR